MLWPPHVLLRPGRVGRIAIAAVIIYGLQQKWTVFMNFFPGIFY